MPDNIADNGLKFLAVGEGSEQRAVAVRQHAGATPGLFWLGGYKSDMKGTKAQALADWAMENKRACVRFDYSGHGESGGAFTDGTIGRWLAEALLWKRFTPEIKRELAERGVWARPSQYSPEPYLVTRQLLEEGRHHLLLGGVIETGCPVRILQGVQDPDVPWQHAKALVARFACDDVVLTLIKDGDHRLSRPEDIERLIRAVEEF